MTSELPNSTIDDGEPWRQALAAEQGIGSLDMPNSVPQRVLLIEDDLDRRCTLACALRAGGFEVIEAPTGQNALDAARELPDLVVLSQRFGAKGLDVCHQIKLDPDTRAVLVLELCEGQRAASDHGHSSDAGADAYLAHPIHPNTLIATVRSLLRLRERERARLERIRQLFFALAHDLQNSLYAIALGCDLLRQADTLNELENRALRRIMSSGRRMNLLIDQRLLLAQRLSDDQLTLVPRAGDLAVIVNESVEYARLRDQRCTIELAGPERVDGVWDSDRLGHVVDNLLGNAIRYGDGAIAVTLAEDGRHVILTVHNGGPPIPLSIQPTLFDPFRRAGRASGAGLGLYLVDRIVRAHHGTIEVTSTAQSGTTVRVRLPRSLEQ